jgi:hypothetical protein
MFDIRMSEFQPIKRNDGVYGKEEESILISMMNSEFIYGIERLMQMISIRVYNSLWGYMNGLTDDNFTVIAHHIVSNISEAVKEEQKVMAVSGYVYGDDEYLLSLVVSKVVASSRLISLDVKTRNQQLSFDLDFYRKGAANA